MNIRYSTAAKQKIVLIVILLVIAAWNVFAKPVDTDGNNLSVPVLAEKIPSVKESGVEARESICRETSRRRNPKAKSDSLGAQNLSERGDVKCDEKTVYPVVAKTMARTTQTAVTRSSAASNVQPADAACTQRVAAPVETMFQEKISLAEMYVRLIDERRIPWTEPSRLQNVVP
jgi:hypothetical protein